MVAPIIAAGGRVLARRAVSRRVTTNTTRHVPPSRGFGFWLLLGFNFFGDIMQAIALVIEAAGAATGVGIGLSLMFMFLMSGFFFVLSCVNITYAMFTGRRQARAVVATAIAFAVKAVPVLNLFPIYSISFYLADYFERKGIAAIPGVSMARKLA